MNEVFEKIIEKLEENSFENGKDSIPVHYVRLNKAIEIVKQASEEFAPDTNVGSNGWIPCNEMLPEDGVPVLIQDFEGYYSLGVSETNRKIKGFRDGDWWASANNYLAWMPLPEPYKEEGKCDENY